MMFSEYSQITEPEYIFIVNIEKILFRSTGNTQLFFYCFPFRRAFMIRLYFLPHASIVADNRQTCWEAYRNVCTEMSNDTETGDKNTCVEQALFQRGGKVNLWCVGYYCWVVVYNYKVAYQFNVINVFSLNKLIVWPTIKDWNNITWIVSCCPKTGFI